MVTVFKSFKAIRLTEKSPPPPPQVPTVLHAVYLYIVLCLSIACVYVLYESFRLAGRSQYMYDR